MEFFKTRINYSYIGEYTDFLIQNEQRIKNLMIDYEIQSKVDPLPPPYSKTQALDGKNSKQPSKSYARARKPPTKALKKHTTHCQNTL